MISSLFKKRNNITLFFAVVAGTFGGFYSFISDVVDLSSYFASLTEPVPIIARIGVSLALAIIIFLSIYSASFFKNRLASLFGFKAVHRRWFPVGVNRRIQFSRDLFRDIVSNVGNSVILASVSGEWDICRPFTEKELIEIFNIPNFEMLVLLSHPESESLRYRCEQEKGQALPIMKQKIIHNTEYLQRIGYGKCMVKWSFSPPIFHIFANGELMHYSPFVDGTPGHDTPRYVVDAKSPIYKSYRRWFNNEWEQALDPAQEMKWVKNEVQGTKAIFLDRDNTLIQDICYFSDIKNTSVEVFPGVVEGLKLFMEKNYRLIVISNQQSVGLNIVTKEELLSMTKKIKSEFEIYNIYFSSFYYCKHSIAEKCNCRKPETALFEQAVKKYHLNTAQCHFIGDSEADAQVAGRIPGLKVHMIDENNNFLDVAKQICSQH